MGNFLGITNTMIFALGFIFTVYLAKKSGKI
jgi:hypothetical protein